MARGKRSPTWTWADYHRQMAKAELRRGRETADEPPAERDPIFEKICELLHTQTLDLAQRANVHHSTLYQWQSGRTRNPQLNTIRRVATALGLRLDIDTAPRGDNVVPLRKSTG